MAIDRGEISYPSAACMALLLITTTAPNRVHAEVFAEAARFPKAQPITIDGHTYEQAWMAAQPLTRFFETYPRNVAEPAVSTEARFLYDDKYIYIGVTAHEPDPASIRSGIVRRDRITTDQDYIEVFLDPLNSGRQAFVFTVNPHGARNDGQFSEDEQVVDTRPDLDFDVEASVNERDWQVEFRIPLQTLRYRTGSGQAWNFVIYRNRPRLNKTTIQSSPEPREATCTLCFAGQVGGISIDTSAPMVYATPQITYSHDDNGHDVRPSLDAKWMPRSDTVVDLTVKPDFSQVEADDLQLTANAQFTLAVKEKRPFFLEGADLFSTPILAIYSRAFVQPQAGMRITHRGDVDDYSALVLRDQSGGLIVEPGPLSSTVVAQPFDSNAIIGRYKYNVGDFTWGALASTRQHEGVGGGANYVSGVDGTWSPTHSDRITVQALASATTNPDRPALLASWDGRHLDGNAYSVMWQHASDKWYATMFDSGYSAGFRAWNGFVPQVDVSTRTVTSGLLFYPNGKWPSRVSTGVIYTGSRQLGGGDLTNDIAPSLSLTLPYSTDLTISWSPDAKSTSFAGARTYKYWAVTLMTTPAVWMPGVTVISTFGNGIDFSTGDVNNSISLIATVPLRIFDRLELIADLGYEAQDSRDDGKRLFTQRNIQFDALWHFSSKLYAQALYQNSHFTSEASADGSRPRMSSTRETFSALLSYQANWQTRYFIGLRNGIFGDRATESSDIEVFAKFSYVLSKWK